MATTTGTAPRPPATPYTDWPTPDPTPTWQSLTHCQPPAPWARDASFTCTPLCTRAQHKCATSTLRPPWLGGSPRRGDPYGLRPSPAPLPDQPTTTSRRTTTMHLPPNACWQPRNRWPVTPYSRRTAHASRNQARAVVMCADQLAPAMPPIPRTPMPIWHKRPNR